MYYGFMNKIVKSLVSVLIVSWPNVSH